MTHTHTHTHTYTFTRTHHKNLAGTVPTINDTHTYTHKHARTHIPPELGWDCVQDLQRVAMEFVAVAPVLGQPSRCTHMRDLYIYTPKHPRTHTHMHTCTHTHTRANARAHPHKLIHAHKHHHTYTCTHTDTEDRHTNTHMHTHPHRLSPTQIVEPTRESFSRRALE